MQNITQNTSIENLEKKNQRLSKNVLEHKVIINIKRDLSPKRNPY